MATPRDIFDDGLREIYHAERKLEKTLAAMARSVRSDKLRSVLFGHRDVTQRQIERLQKVFEHLEKKPSGRSSKAADALAKAPGEDDLAVIVHALKIEHYELATYKALVKLAQGETLRRARSLLEKNMTEEENAGTELEHMVTELEEEAAKASS